jgi:hypothetical protein
MRLTTLQIILVSIASMITAITVILGVLRRLFRAPLREFRHAVANAAVLVNGRPEEHAAWDDSHVLSVEIKPATARLEQMEQMGGEIMRLTQSHSGAIDTIRAEVTMNGGRSIKDAVKRIEQRLDGIEQRLDGIESGPAPAGI